MEKYVHDKHIDIVHAHDWITFLAADKVKCKKNIPMVAHIHATEFDRTGGNPNEEILHREKEGLNKADKIITVSNYTKNTLKNKYGINEEKIRVVHNGINLGFKN